MKFPLFLMALLFLSGCSHLSSPDSTADRLQQLDRYLASQQFDKALFLLDDTPEVDTNKETLAKERRIVLEQLELFEKQVITTALKQEQESDWSGAKRTYREALEKARTSLEIQEAEKDMLQRFEERMEALKLEELIVSGSCLRKKLPLLKQQHMNHPEHLAIKWNYLKAEEEAKSTGMELLQFGEKMLDENNIEMAKRMIPLAHALVPGVETKEAAARLNKVLKSRQQKVQQDLKKVAKEKDKKEIEALHYAIAQGKLALALQHLQSLSPASRNTMEAQLMQERLNQAIAAYVEERDAIGAAFYRVGEYEQAIGAWNTILELEPDNEAVKTKVERAERIVQNLKIMRERQDQE